MYQDYNFHSDQQPHTQKYLSAPIEKSLQQLGSKNLLDVGCGNGAFAAYLLSKSYNVHGIDASQTGIEIARKNYGKDRFFVQNVESETLTEELKDIPFDTIISTEVVEHVYSPKQYMQFCHNILAPRGGHIIISTPYHGYLKNVALALSGKMDNHFTALWEGGHIKFFSKKTLSTLMEQSGFEVVGFYGAGRLPYLWKSMILVGKAKTI